MKQKLFIEEFEVLASIGVYENEKKRKQRIVFNVEIQLKESNAPLRDRLKEVTDYGQFRKIILNKIDGKHYNLLEKLAKDISKEFFKIDTIEKVRIKITKPDIFDDCTVSFQISSD
tara:strand:- start:294 stop:641 length:348 start_codon:yes stop_codon:yes gene_type:complete